MPWAQMITRNQFNVRADRYFFEESPPWQSVCGAGLVMACAVVAVLKKRAPPPDGERRKGAPRPRE